MKNILTILMLVFVSQCSDPSVKDQPYDPKFTGLIQMPDGDWYRGWEELLIYKVHDPIHYYVNLYVGTDDHQESVQKCGEMDLQQLDQNIERALKTWLLALDEGIKAQNIATKVAPESGNHSAINLSPEKTLNREGADLIINLHCRASEKDSRSFAKLTTFPVQAFLKLNEQGNASERILAHQHWGVNYSTILHEIGHLFGLDDLYVEEGVDDTKLRRHQTKFSLMNDSIKIGFLTEDDRQAIVWLYRYHILKELQIHECPIYYEFDESSNGCLPVINAQSPVYQNLCAEAGGEILGNRCFCSSDSLEFNPLKHSEMCKLRTQILFPETSHFCKFKLDKQQLMQIDYYPFDKRIYFQFKTTWSPAINLTKEQWSWFESLGLRNYDSIDDETIMSLLEILKNAPETENSTWIPRECFTTR